jgi:hypothetical protein
MNHALDERGVRDTSNGAGSGVNLLSSLAAAMGLDVLGVTKDRSVLIALDDGRIKLALLVYMDGGSFEIHIGRYQSPPWDEVIPFPTAAATIAAATRIVRCRPGNL